MDDLMKCLYEFVNTQRMAAMEGDQEYKASVRSILRQEDKVREYLTEDQRRELTQLMMEVANQNAIENEYLFQAALALARELNALVRA